MIKLPFSLLVLLVLLVLGVFRNADAQCSTSALGAPCDEYDSQENLFKNKIVTAQQQANTPKGATFEARVAGALSATERFSTLAFENPETGEVGEGGSAVIQERGAQKPVAQITSFGINHAVKSQLEDELWVGNMMSGWLSTKAGMASAAIAFSQPAAATVYSNTVISAYSHVDLCLQSHNTYIASLSQYPNGIMLRDIYLGCIERMTQEDTNSPNSASLVSDAPRASLCNAISICQSDSYEPKTDLVSADSDSGYWPTIDERLDRTVEKGFIPEHDPCHPLHPNFEGTQWSNAQKDEAGEDLVRRRILLTDKLFCEYHADDPGSDPTATEIRETGLLAESYFRKFVGNAALIWPEIASSGSWQGTANIEWQKVQPRKLYWPPDPTPPLAPVLYPAPEVMPLYRAGEIFTMLTQFMENRCRAHNAMVDVDFRSASSLNRVGLSTANLQFRNGENLEPALSSADFEQLVKEGFCSTEIELIDQQRAFVSIPQLPFSGNLCDAFWYRTRAHFEQRDQFDCEKLRGCLQGNCGPGITCKDGNTCFLSYADMRDNIENYPIWAQMFFAYATVGGHVVFRNELRLLYSQIEVMTGSRNTWMLQMAKELIESRLDDSVEDDNEEILAALREEVEKAIKEERDNKKGGAIVSSGGTSMSRTAPGQSS